MCTTTASCYFSWKRKVQLDLSKSKVTFGYIYNHTICNHVIGLAGCHIILPRESETVLLGAAILGAVAAQKYSGVHDAMRALNAAGQVDYQFMIFSSCINISYTNHISWSISWFFETKWLQLVINGWVSSSIIVYFWNSGSDMWSIIVEQASSDVFVALWLSQYLKHLQTLSMLAFAGCTSI